MLDSTSISTIILLASASILLLLAMLHPSSLLRWLQRKRYQYEVTFSLYMLTSTEKFIFNSILFLLLSLLIIAASLYLPEHVMIMCNRILYYFSGDEQTLTSAGANKAAREVMTASSNIVKGAATSFLGGAQENVVRAGGMAGNGRGVMDP